MAKLQCSCGNSMSNSTVPSKDIVFVFKKSVLLETMKKDSNISLFDFETSDFNSKFEYWYCSDCKRIHVVDNSSDGRVVDTYSMIHDDKSFCLEDTKEIYVFSDEEIYDAEEDDPNLTLASFIERNSSEHLYYLSLDEDKVFKARDTNVGQLIYIREKK